MATGYTYKVLEGCSFEDFVWACARGMGALVHMHEMPSDAPIPINKASFDSSNYPEKSLQRINEELSRFESFTDDDWKEWFDAQEEKEKVLHKELSEKEKHKRDILEAMLKRVEEWEPPKEHGGLKAFMLDQLRSTIKFECHGYSHGSRTQAKKESREEVLSRLRKDKSYWERKISEDRKRERGRVEWLQALDASVPRPPRLVPESER